MKILVLITVLLTLAALDLSHLSTMLAAVDFSAVQVAALAAAAVLSIPITHVLKKAAGINGGAALVLAGGISATLAIVAMFSTGQARTAQDIFLNVTGVFAVAQVIFKAIVYADRAQKGETG